MHLAGVAWFLENLAQWRGEADYDSGYWATHLTELRDVFGEDSFTASEAIAKIQQGAVLETPPAWKTPGPRVTPGNWERHTAGSGPGGTALRIVR